LMMTFGKPFKITEQNKSFLTEEILQTALAQYFSKVFWGENANANHVELLASSLQEKELVPVTRFYDLTYPGLTDNYAARVLLRKLQKSEVFDRILSILADPPTKTEFNPFTDERFKVSFTVQTDPAYPNMRQVRYLCLEITDPLVGLDKVKVIFYAQLPIPSNATLAKNQGRPIFTIVQIDKYQGTARAPRTAYLEDSLLNFIYKTTDNGKDGFQLKANFAQWLYQYLVFGTSYVDKKFKYGIYRNIGIYRYELSGLWRLAARYFSVDDPNRTDLQIMFPYGVGKHNNNNYENYDSNDTDKSIVSRAEICARSLTQEPSIERTFYLDKNGWHEQNF
ncbi:MAG: hypothetical protein J6Y94_00505, partial [Bacteriovoracaceae bacterium]|nr:hypothetical protein [Bacteriovoracaceae bacterium]